MSNEEYGAMPTMLCCICGIEITPNPSNMCVACLRNEVDITSMIPSQLTMHSCRGCQRFLLPPWMKVDLESKELMSACLRKIPGLSKLKVVDAVWIWTEPHSLRLKIKLTIQKEVMNGAILQQAKIIEFTIRNQQCKTCQSFYAQGVWHAVVQVRQHVSHKRTFFYLEQVLLKYNAHSDCLQITTFKDGMDFYFMDKQQALRFIDFLEGKVPIQIKYSRKLLTADHKSNVGKFKHNYMVTICTVCKDDLTLLPNDLARNLSNISPLVLVKAINSGIVVVDPFTGERQDINTEKYFRDEFGAVMTSRQLISFVVLSVEPVLTETRPTARKRGIDRKMRLAEVVVARERDFGVNDTQFVVLSHLGHLLREGDLVQGYDMTSATWTGDELDRYKESRKGDLPDVILVRKNYTAKKDRLYDLKPLDFDEQEFPSSSRENETRDHDYELFLQELDADKDMRTHVNLYKNKKIKERNLQLLKSSKRRAAGGDEKTAGEENDMERQDDNHNEGEEEQEEDNEDEEEVRLEELLDALDLAVNDTVDPVTGDGENERGGIILTIEEAAQIPAIPLEVNEFDVTQYDPKDYKFL